MNKYDTQIFHSIKRAKERYGKEFKKEDILRISKGIRKGNLLLNGGEDSMKITNTRTFHRVFYRDVIYNVIYDRLRGTLCTFLPSDIDSFEKLKCFNHEDE